MEVEKRRGRPCLNEKEKREREILKQRFLEHSIDAFETILNIMKDSKDDKIRLKASTYILNKVIPNGYIFEEKEMIDRNIIVNLVTQEEKYKTISYEEQEQIIRKTEMEENMLDLSWENEIYIPERSK